MRPAATQTKSLSSEINAEAAYLCLQGVSKVYATHDGPVRALEQVSVGARRGEFLSVLGPSGCGKSTLLMIAAGLLRPSNGAVSIDGAVVTRPRTDIGIVFQSPVLLEWRTALGNVMLQAEAKKLERTAAERRARDLLASVGLAGFEDKYPHELSGGMRQRVSLCRALIHTPHQLMMDEPFGALDALTREAMNVELQRIWLERRKTVLFVTHSTTEAVFLADRVLVMTPRPGRIGDLLTIDFPRPRSLDVMTTEAFGAHVRRIRTALNAGGGIE